MREANTEMASAEDNQAYFTADPHETSNNYAKSALAMSTIAFVATVASAWIVFGAEQKQLSGLDRAALWAQSAATTWIAAAQYLTDLIIATLNFIFDSFVLTGVLGVLAILIFIATWIVVSAISKDWNPLDTYNTMTKWLADAIYDDDALTDIPKNGVQPESQVVSMGAGTAGVAGSVQGNAYDIQMVLGTTIEMTTSLPNTGGHESARGPTTDDLKHSWGFGTMLENTAAAPSWTTGYVVTNAINASSIDADVAADCDPLPAPTVGPGTPTPTPDAGPTATPSSTKRCYNTVSITFNAARSGRNMAVPFINQVAAKLRYQICEWDKTGNTKWDCSADWEYQTGPDDDTAPSAYANAQQAIYMDILPNKLDDIPLWNVPNESGAPYADWSRDRDFDMIVDTYEITATHTLTSTWDTDGDGLSDGFEHANQDRLQTDPTLADTDGDGLDDALELALATKPHVADSDGDNLSDGEEVCHMEGSGVTAVITGGWAVTIGSGSYWVCSDPNKADSDADLITDDNERAGATSPYAPNVAPALNVRVEPQMAHLGKTVSPVKPGETYSVTLNLANTTALSVTHPMTLDYSATDLGTMSLTGPQTSSPLAYTPPTPTPFGDGLYWDFASQPLHAVESFTAPLGGTVVDTAVSKVSPLSATLTYVDPVSQTLNSITLERQVLIDAEDP